MNNGSRRSSFVVAGLVVGTLIAWLGTPVLSLQPEVDAQTTQRIALPLLARHAVSAGGFTFVAYGDSRAGGDCTGNAVHAGLVARMAAEPAQLGFHLGDMITGYNANSNWALRGACTDAASSGSFKELIAPLQSKTPAPGLPMFLFPVIGNHDDNWGDGWYPDPQGDTICDVFDMSVLVPNHTQQPYFRDTTNRVAHYSDAQFKSLTCSTSDSSVYPTYMYYSFDYQNAHFVVMRVNSEYYDLLECYSSCADESNYDAFYYRHQYDWLRADLAAAAARSDIDHVFVFIHAPLFTSADGHVANSSWQALATEFTANGKVRFVFSGHNHVYERSVPIVVSPSSPNGARDDATGTVYLTTGGGGSDLHGFNAANPLIVVRDSLYHYVRVDVNGENVTVTAINTLGVPFDHVSR